MEAERVCIGLEAGLADPLERAILDSSIVILGSRVMECDAQWRLKRVGFYTGFKKLEGKNDYSVSDKITWTTLQE